MAVDDSRTVGDVGSNMASLPSMDNNHSLWRKCHRPLVIFIAAKAADEKTGCFATSASPPRLVRLCQSLCEVQRVNWQKKSAGSVVPYLRLIPG
jgi:hypothetical protein